MTEILPRSRWLAALSGIAGFLTFLVGLTAAVAGLGFANCTACGSGLGMVFVGIWMIFAMRGLAQRRPVTQAGLALAWAWILVRAIFDFGAMAAAAMLFFFLLPMVSIPIFIAWAVTLVAFWIGLAIRLWPTVPARPPLRFSRPVGTTTILLAVMVLITFLAPQLGWKWRGDEIAKLASKYSETPPKPTKPAQFGACSMSFLGYSLTQHGAENCKDTAKRQKIYDRVLGDAEAELASAKTAGAMYLRLGASGDQLLTSKPEQEGVDDRCVSAVTNSGLKLVLVDTQHPDVCRKHRLSWPEFCQFQKDRITYYQKRYEPEVYMVVCEPMTYHGFALAPGTTYSATDWAAQLSEMCRLVKSLNPRTRTGICLLVMKDKEPEWEVWSRMKTLPELDILSVEIYQPEDFAATQDRLAKYGHPRASGKEFWIAETYNGWAMNSARRWDHDAKWIEVTKDFAQVVDAEAVLVWSFCSFVPEGSFWDFGSGRLKQKWEKAKGLSLVGRTFQKIAAGANQTAR